MNKTYAQLLEGCAHQRIINTHSHHLPNDQQGNTLAWMLDNSYVSWCGVEFRENRRDYLRRLAGNSYFYWMQRAMTHLCGMDKPLGEDNWEEYDARVAALCLDPDKHLRILREECGYDHVILDGHWQPGDDNGHPELFSPTYRIDMYLVGYAADARDHDENNPFSVNGWDPMDCLETYIGAMRREVLRHKAAGCVALKCAIAYDRGLDFAPATADEARAAFGNPSATPAQIKAFQDYVFDELCAIAAETKLPMQVHTGLGCAYRSNAAWLRDAIVRHPEITFSLMHGSYPWTQDLLALAHNYRNVVADICWLPILSTSACERFVAEWVDIGDMDRITWGCDTWQSIESYGAVLAARETLSRVFADLVERGRMSASYAQTYIRHILRDNALSIYGIKP